MNSNCCLQKVRTAVIKDASSQAHHKENIQFVTAVCGNLSCSLAGGARVVPQKYDSNSKTHTEHASLPTFAPKRLPSSSNRYGMQDGKEWRTWSKVLSTTSPLATKVMNYRRKKLYGSSGGFSSKLSVCPSRK